jgi:hypothetical protein
MLEALIPRVRGICEVDARQWLLMEVKKTNHRNTYGGLAIGFGLR